MLNKELKDYCQADEHTVRNSYELDYYDMVNDVSI